MSSVFVKGLALGAAAMGFGLLNGARRHEDYEAGLHVEHMVDDDHWHHTMETMGDYSPYTGLNALKHKIFDPSIWHFIKRPWIHIKSYAGLFMDNLVPIGLMFVGLTYAFNGSILGNLSKMANLLGRGGRLVFNSLSQVGKSLWELTYRSMPHDLLPRIAKAIPKDPKGILAVASAVGMGLYTMHLFKREVTGENHLDAMNYLRQQH